MPVLCWTSRRTGSRKTDPVKKTGTAQQAHLHVGQRPQVRRLNPQLTVARRRETHEDGM